MVTVRRAAVGDAAEVVRLRAVMLGSMDGAEPAPGPWQEAARATTGYVFNVVTDPAYRRRGYSRACLEALLDWCRKHGVGKVDLRASADGEPLYRSLGFVPTPGPTLRLPLPPAPG
ncbi:GNAT family N-acetyltransferase [Micromonospora sp. PTRAS2]|uniref:GNAT family N-acetyltransferase n=1 Tax=Micromonospora haikouensis TaxID=686309 RepID=UPI0037BCE9AD